MSVNRVRATCTIVAFHEINPFHDSNAICGLKVQDTSKLFIKHFSNLRKTLNQVYHNINQRSYLLGSNVKQSFRTPHLRAPRQMSCNHNKVICKYEDEYLCDHLHVSNTYQHEWPFVAENIICEIPSFQWRNKPNYNVNIIKITRLWRVNTPTCTSHCCCGELN